MRFFLLLVRVENGDVPPLPLPLPQQTNPSKIATKRYDGKGGRNGEKRGNSPTHVSFQLYAKSINMTCCTTTKIIAPILLTFTYHPRYQGVFDTNIVPNTTSRYATYLDGQCRRFDIGSEWDSTDAIPKYRNATDVGRIAPAFPTHLSKAASSFPSSSSSRYLTHPDVQPS